MWGLTSVGFAGGAKAQHEAEYVGEAGGLLKETTTGGVCCLHLHGRQEVVRGRDDDDPTP
jgi:hypothetical protein